MGLELGRHEDSEHLFPADTVRDVAIYTGRADSFGGLLLEKNSVARIKMLAVDNLIGRLANGT